MQIKIEELQNVMLQAMRARGLSSEEALQVVEPFIEAEIRNKKTHGISKFFMIEDAIASREEKPEIITDKFNYALINAHKELGYITAQFATDILIDKAKEYGNSMVGVINSYYYSMAGIYARKVAKAGFVSLIFNNGGPQGVVPFGGIDSIFGTNPIAVGIPTEEDPIVLDMATSEKTWGEINLAKVEGRQLQENTFLDKEGNFTTDPYKAESIISFGGYKGYGLNFVFEILTGALVGAKMGLQSKNGYDLGFFFIAISPEMFTTREKFNANITQLIKEVKNSRAMAGKKVNIPGEQSDEQYNKAIEQGSVELKEEMWNQLLRFAKGENIKSQVGLVE